MALEIVSLKWGLGMSRAEGSSDAGVSLRDLEQIDALCLDFERGWQSGDPVDIDVPLAAAAEDVPRPQLFRELLRIELAYRCRRGELPAVESYQEKFPSLFEVLAEVFAESSRDTPPSDEATSPVTATFNPPALSAGSKFGPYRVLTKLGQGGMGTVYKAQHEHLDKTVALKVLSPLITQHADSVSRFKREMKAVGKLDHPHIIRAMDAGEIDGVHFISMEYIDGIDLHRLVKVRGPFSVPAACTAVRQAALALTAAHAVGVIHRDIKPSNLLLTNAGQIKLLDLGLARLAEDTVASTELTTAGKTLGTPDYMAPEQWEDPHAADPRSDIYALGCTLYYLLAGHPPYGTEQYRTFVGKMKAHVTADIPRLPTTGPEIPKGLVAVYGKLLAKSPTERYQTAAEVADALAPFASSSIPVSVRAGSGDDVPGEQLTASATKADPLLHPTVSETRDLQTTQKVKSQAAGSGHRWTPRQLALSAGGAAIALLLTVIVITITRSDGTKAKIRIPEGVEVDVQAPHGSKVTIDGEGSTPAELAATQTDWQGWPADAPPPAIAPFNAEQAKKHQEACAAYLKAPVEYANSIGMKFRIIPPGEFLIGSTHDEVAESLAIAIQAKTPSSWLNDIRSESPQRQVTIGKPLFFGETEVTISQFREFIETTHFVTETEQLGGGIRYDVEKKRDVTAPTLLWSTPGYPVTDDTPVTEVTWNDAVAFCNWLSAHEHRNPAYERNLKDNWELLAGADGYRLPTEAEWEYACRAGTTTQYSFGSDVLQFEQFGWCSQNSRGVAHDVAQMKPNAFGLFDMHGNVWEWTQDWYDRNLDEKTNSSDPMSSSSVQGRVVRGGNWRELALRGRSAYRASARPNYPTNHIGFRVVLAVEALKTVLNRDRTDKAKSHPD